MDREALRNEILLNIKKTDDTYLTETSVYYNIMHAAFIEYLKRVPREGAVLERFLSYIDNSQIMSDLVELRSPLDQVYSNTEIMYKILMEVKQVDELNIIKQLPIVNALPQIPLEEVAITRGTFSAITRLIREYDLTCTEILRYIDFDSLDLYSWRFDENIPLIRESLVLNFKMNYTSELIFNSKPILRETEGV